jgi:argininosuccinate lyase
MVRRSRITSGRIATHLLALDRDFVETANQLASCARLPLGCAAAAGAGHLIAPVRLKTLPHQAIPLRTHAAGSNLAFAASGYDMVDDAAARAHQPL